MNVKRTAFKAAFPYTIPICTGFLFLGLAYGLYMNQMGFSFLYPMLISLTVFAGSMQFVAVNLLICGFDPLYAFALTLMVNARHLFYGISMLDKYKSAGKKKFYLIFGMCDETFSINCSVKPPEGVDEGWFMFFITLLNHCYWLIGSTLGGVLGSLITVEIKGIEFVMTALFVVIFLDQWRSKKQHLPAIVGVVASAICLIAFRPDNFLVFAMLLILLALTAFRRYCEKGDKLK